MFIQNCLFVAFAAQKSSHTWKEVAITALDETSQRDCKVSYLTERRDSSIFVHLFFIRFI